MKFTKKILAVLLSALLVVACFAGCSASSDDKDDNKPSDNNAAAVDMSDIKVGFIFLHDENSTYDKNFITAADEACKALGIKDENKMYKTNVPEDNKCYDAACELADAGCSFVFADSFSHESYLMQAAKEYPDVQFCHATGTNAHTANIPNLHNAFASIYEGRYLAGIAAGMKLNEMIEKGDIKPEEAKMGYVGAYTYAEVISGYTSFFLGARSVCPTATMEVTFTGLWYDETKEKEGANKLINNGCVLISQHADSMGAPTACESKGVPNVSYNGSTRSAGPNTFIVSSRINWAPYFEYAITATAKGETIDNDWTGTLDTDSVQLLDLNTDVAAEGTQDAIDKATAGLKDGSIKVFDTSAFTVTVAADKNKNAKVDADGHLTSYMADVDTDPAYTPDTEAVADGYFHESEYRSAPYFDIQIDGINLLDVNFG